MHAELALEHRVGAGDLLLDARVPARGLSLVVGVGVGADAELAEGRAGGDRGGLHFGGAERLGVRALLLPGSGKRAGGKSEQHEDTPHGREDGPPPRVQETSKSGAA